MGRCAWSEEAVGAAGGDYGDTWPNKTDFAFVKGWPSTAPRPPDLSVGGWRVGDVTASVEPVIQETEYTSGTEFVLHDKLRTAGWSVRPVQAVVVGHRAGVSEFNEMACAAMGVACKNE